MNLTNKSLPLPIQVIYRFSYALNLHQGAKKTCNNGDARIEQTGLPTFLLIGFSLENAFAAYLIACEHQPHADYKKHDILKAMAACARYGLVFSKRDQAFIAALNPHHKDFIFRYPEKMDRIDIGSMRDALAVTQNILRDVDVGLKIKGFNVGELSKELPDDG
jgi:hypothetical protein